ncbi:MAG: tyrosine-type recombinase/integrase [Romboutsia timonensis]|uniref:tyrosine-type recombinase/integrase n=1 Tax=Romboutsia timonensis TaxID=1776391 RepID=UPI002A74CEE8|nr:tyrosine-type recombinase/integrase [Romboutsia timonensis]MDY2882985.1 tyrosine-type recombinase/integrase [Romboutsia timonensis]
MAVKTRPITIDEYNLILDKMCSTFTYKTTNKDGEVEDKLFRANFKVAYALQLQANLGLRVGDVLKLTLNDFIPDGRGSFKLSVTEQKTGKVKDVVVNDNLYNNIKLYTLENNIKADEPIVKMSVRNVQMQLKIVCDELGINSVSTHSFRKFYAMRLFEDSGYNFEVVRALLNHSNVAITQKYLGVTNEEIEKASKNHNYMRNLKLINK